MQEHTGADFSKNLALTLTPCLGILTPMQSPLLARITIDPVICHGKPCIRGLRYPVETILELLSAGMTTDEILADYPDLERDDILAALSFATELSRVKRLDLVTP